MILRAAVLVLFCALPSLAQTPPLPPAQAAAPIAPGPNEDPGELTARVRYERALRAELDGRAEDAVREARAALEASPKGRFGQAARELIDRVQKKTAGAAPTGEAMERTSGSGPRVELVLTSTAGGLYLGALAAGAAQTGAKGTTGLLMLGTGVGLVGSLLGSSGRRVPQSMPQLLENGLIYGTSVSVLAQAIAYSNNSSRNLSVGAVFAGAAIGGVAGLAVSPFLTGGDAGAMSAGMFSASLLPVAIEVALGVRSNALLWTAIVGGTAGLIGGPLLNQQHAHWSRGRWNLITLGGAVGALMGGGVAILTDAFQANNGRAGVAVLAGGTALGLAATAFLTQDFGVDEPRPGAASLLHLEDGKLSAGEVLSALSPINQNGRTGGFLRLADGRF